MVFIRVLVYGLWLIDVVAGTGSPKEYDQKKVKRGVVGVGGYEGDR